MVDIISLSLTKRKRKKLLKIIGIILAIVVLFFAVTSVITVVGRSNNMKKIESFEQVKIENQLVPVEDENGYWTFTTDEDFKVLQLTDIHIGGGWMSGKKDAMALNAVAAMVTAEKPDLVIVTGDIAYPVPPQAGTDDNLASAKMFANLMEKLGVYWTVTFGNHDSESYSYFDREAVAALYGSGEFEYCLFQAGPEDVDGFGNHTIEVKNSDGIITQAMILIDSQAYIKDNIICLKTNAQILLQPYRVNGEGDTQWPVDHCRIIGSYCLRALARKTIIYLSIHNFLVNANTTPEKAVDKWRNSPVKPGSSPEAESSSALRPIRTLKR